MADDDDASGLDLTGFLGLPVRYGPKQAQRTSVLRLINVAYMRPMFMSCYSKASAMMHGRLFGPRDVACAFVCVPGDGRRLFPFTLIEDHTRAKRIRRSWMSRGTKRISNLLFRGAL